MDDKIPHNSNYKFVGYIYSSGYREAKVFTTERLLEEAGGIATACFLIASPLPIDTAIAGPHEDALLLRVIGKSDLPNKAVTDLTRLDRIGRLDGPLDQMSYDPFTKAKVQESCLDARILGTYYQSDAGLVFANDVQSLPSATGLYVYKPVGKALEAIINHFNPDQLAKIPGGSKDLGPLTEVTMTLGKVQYASAGSRAKMPLPYSEYKIRLADFVAKRTIMVGMTRSGKSNAVKTLVADTHILGGNGVGQIILDPDGGYANSNSDGFSIFENFPNDTRRYSMIGQPGFQELKNNFYFEIQDGLSVIKSVIPHTGPGKAQDVTGFMEANLDEPPVGSSVGDIQRWKVHVAAHQSLLYKADFPAPPNHKVSFEANQNIRAQVELVTGRNFPDPRYGLDLETTADWFLAVREVNQTTPLTSSGSGKPWVDVQLESQLNMLARRNSNGAFINGYKVLAPAVRFHSASRTDDVLQEMYDYAADGDIVVVDLSSAPAEMREHFSERIGRKVFTENVDAYIRGEVPPYITLYAEECHNLFGRDAKLTDTWPKIAKEGGKYGIGLVAATQQPSSIDDSILSQCENWFLFHLNGDREIRVLEGYYDFTDFADGLKQVDEVGLARVRTYSSHFTVPVKISKYGSAVTPNDSTENEEDSHAV